MERDRVARRSAEGSVEDSISGVSDCDVELDLFRREGGARRDLTISSVCCCVGFVLLKCLRSFCSALKEGRRDIHFAISSVIVEKVKGRCENF